MGLPCHFHSDYEAHISNDLFDLYIYDCIHKNIMYNIYTDNILVVRSLF